MKTPALGLNPTFRNVPSGQFWFRVYFVGYTWRQFGECSSGRCRGHNNPVRPPGCFCQTKETLPQYFLCLPISSSFIIIVNKYYKYPYNIFLYIYYIWKVKRLNSTIFSWDRFQTRTSASRPSTLTTPSTSFRSPAAPPARQSSQQLMRSRHFVCRGTCGQFFTSQTEFKEMHQYK